MAQSQETRYRRASNLLLWFDVRRRRPGMWAFVLNRLTAIGLTVYLFIHLVVLFQLSRGPHAYDQFIALVKSPLFVTSELLVVIAGFYHGLNGIRVILTSLGIAVPHQERIFYIVFGIAALTSIIFAIHMYTA